VSNRTQEISISKYQNMTLEEFDSEVRLVIERILNHLQAASLLTIQTSPPAQVEILAAGRLMQELSLLIEEFVVQQRTEQDRRS
jgi:hypothetical protein